MKLILRLALSAFLLAGAGRVIAQLEGVRVAARADSPDRLAAAVDADPRSAEHHFRLGLSRRDFFATQSLEEAERHLRRACALNPHNWSYHLELARTLELAGQPATAEPAYLEALRLNPHSGDYRWQVANFYLRSAQPTKAAKAFGEAVAADPKLAPPAFDILLRMEGEFSQIDEVWPSDGALRLDLLLLAVRRGSESGAEPPLDFLFRQWRHVRDSTPRSSLQSVNSLVEHLLRRGEGERAKRLWLEINGILGVRDESYAAGTNMVWNGDFELPAGKGPLDWRIASSDDFKGRYIAETDGGGLSLRIDFLGKQNLDFVGVTQALVVEPGSSLRLSCRIRGEDLTTDQGPMLQVLDQKYHLLLETPAFLGTSDWTTYDGTFTVPDGHSVIHLRIRRRPSSRINSHIQGRLWLDSVCVAGLPNPGGQAAEGGD